MEPCDERFGLIARVAVTRYDIIFPCAKPREQAMGVLQCEWAKQEAMEFRLAFK